MPDKNRCVFIIIMSIGFISLLYSMSRYEVQQNNNLQHSLTENQKILKKIDPAFINSIQDENIKMKDMYKKQKERSFFKQMPAVVQQKNTIPSVSVADSTLIDIEKKLTILTKEIVLETEKISVKNMIFANYIPYNEQLAILALHKKNLESTFMADEKTSVDNTFKKTTQTLANAVITLALQSIDHLKSTIKNHSDDVKKYLINSKTRRTFLKNIIEDKQDINVFHDDINELETLCQQGIIQKGLSFSDTILNTASPVLKQSYKKALTNLISMTPDSLNFNTLFTLWESYFNTIFKNEIKTFDPALMKLIIDIINTHVVTNIVYKILTMWEMVAGITSAAFLKIEISPLQNIWQRYQTIENMLTMLLINKPRTLLASLSAPQKIAELINVLKKHLILYRPTMNLADFEAWKKQADSFIMKIRIQNPTIADNFILLIKSKEQEYLSNIPKPFIQLPQTSTSMDKELTVHIQTLEELEKKITAADKEANAIKKIVPNYTVLDSQLYDIYNACQKIEARLNDTQRNTFTTAYTRVSQALSTAVIRLSIESMKVIEYILKQQAIKVQKELIEIASSLHVKFLQDYELFLKECTAQAKIIDYLFNEGVKQKENIAFSKDIAHYCPSPLLQQWRERLTHLMNDKNTLGSFKNCLYVWHTYFNTIFNKLITKIPLIKANILRNNFRTDLIDTTIERAVAHLITLHELITINTISVPASVLETESIYEQLLSIEQSVITVSGLKNTVALLDDVATQELNLLRGQLDKSLEQPLPSNASLLEKWRQSAYVLLAQIQKINMKPGIEYTQKINEFIQKAEKNFSPTIIIKPSLK